MGERTSSRANAVFEAHSLVHCQESMRGDLPGIQCVRGAVRGHWHLVQRILLRDLLAEEAGLDARSDLPE